jgi:hypothetical protein
MVGISSHYREFLGHPLKETMRRVILIPLLLSATIGVGTTGVYASSPLCQRWVAVHAPKVKHTIDTIHKWDAFNKTPKGKKWLATHPYVQPSSRKTTLLRIDWACDGTEVPTEPSLELTNLVDVPDFTEGSDYIAENDSPGVPVGPGSPVTTVPTTGTGYPVVYTPIFGTGYPPGGPGGGGTVPPPITTPPPVVTPPIGVPPPVITPPNPVPEPSTYILLLTGLGILVVLKSRG